MCCVIRKTLKMRFLFIILSVSIFDNGSSENCLRIDERSVNSFKKVLPPLGGRKGDAGVIGIISEFIPHGAYFAGICALKAGADLVRIITTENITDVVQSYSPNYLVMPFMHRHQLNNIKARLPLFDVIVFGPGSSVELNPLYYDILDACRELKKPLIIDAAGAMLAITKNISVIRNYPAPGVILTPNYGEYEDLLRAAGNLSSLGEFVSFLYKSERDYFYSSEPSLNWVLGGIGTGKRTAGQGDMLAGTLGTFYNYALKSNLCEQPVKKAQSLASYAAAILLRTANQKAFEIYGRSMTGNDIVSVFHLAFKELFD